MVEAHARDVVDTFVTPFPENPPYRVTYTHPTGYFEEGLWAETQVPFDVIRPNVLRAARDFGHEQGALRLVLETGRDNAIAQALYRKLGWIADTTQWFHLPLR